MLRDPELRHYSAVPTNVQLREAFDDTIGSTTAHRVEAALRRRSDADVDALLRSQLCTDLAHRLRAAHQSGHSVAAILRSSQIGVS